jgi:hypothetical protein
MRLYESFSTLKHFYVNSIHCECILKAISCVSEIIVESEQLFEHFEKLSQSIYVREQFKLISNEENAFTIIQLLNDNNYLNLTEFLLNEVLESKTAA